MSPRLLVLDEPFAGLDIPTKSYLTGLLNDLDQSILHITHDTRVISLYDRVVWLEHGRIHYDGTASAVLPKFEDAMQKAYDL